MHCEIEVLDKMPLKQVQGEYLALSYCAGSPDSTAIFSIREGKERIHFNAFANLGHAVHRVYQYWSTEHPNRDLLLWADQICINQADHAERASQVAMMHEIYRNSRMTLVCLSTPSSEPHGLTGWLKGSFFDSPLTSGIDMDIQLAGLLCQQHFSAWEPHHEGDVQEYWAKNHEWISSMQALFACPWRARSWVYQEFVMASQVRFVWAEETKSLEELAPQIRFVCREIPLAVQAWSDAAAAGRLSSLLKDIKQRVVQYEVREVLQIAL